MSAGQGGCRQLPGVVRMVLKGDEVDLPRAEPTSERDFDVPRQLTQLQLTMRFTCVRLRSLTQKLPVHDCAAGHLLGCGFPWLVSFNCPQKDPFC